MGQIRSISRFRPYNPDQAYLLPPSVKEVLPSGHLCFFLQEIVAKLDLEPFEQEYSDEGGQMYDPALMLSVWLYAYARGITSGRELERRIQEDLPLRYLAGGAHPDHWALSAFRPATARAEWTGRRNCGGSVPGCDNKSGSGRSAAMPKTIRWPRNMRRSRWRRRKSGWKAFRGGCRGCRRVDENVYREPIPRPGCSSAAASRWWDTRRRSRCRKITSLWDRK